MKIAHIQHIPQEGESPLEYAREGQRLCKKAKEAGAHLCLFPEMWTISYDEKKMTHEYALRVQDEVIQSFQQFARKEKLLIGLTYLACPQVSDPLYNAFILINQEGEILLSHFKNPICDFSGGKELTLTAGPGHATGEISFSGVKVKIGALICFEREFTGAISELSRKGAELILVPNACKMVSDPLLADTRLAQLRGRAFESMCAIALTNFPNSEANLGDGNSCLILPSGHAAYQASEKSEVLISELDLLELKRWRKNEVWGELSSQKKLIEDFYQKNKKELSALHPGLQVQTIFEYYSEGQLNWAKFSKKLLEGTPVAYLSGKAPFYNSLFRVNPHTLIPRPETELLVEHAIQVIDGSGKQHDEFFMCDVGTGSGNIPISILKNCSHPKVTSFAVDLSLQALKQAKFNESLLLGQGLIHFRHSDRLSSFEEERFHLITSNPPYIRPKKHEEGVHKNVHDHEPHSALYIDDASYDQWFEELFKQVWDHLLPGGVFLMEGHEKEFEQYMSLARGLGFSNLEIFEDYNNRPRYLLAKK